MNTSTSQIPGGEVAYGNVSPPKIRRAAFTGGLLGGAIGTVIVQLIIWLIQRG